MTTPRIIISSGDPAGIGPDIVIKALQNDYPFAITVVSDPTVLTARAQQIGIDTKINILQTTTNSNCHQANIINVIPIESNTDVIAGVLNADNSRYTLDCIDLATDMCLQGEYQAMATAPAHKGIINEAGIPFSGHTEWIASRCNSPQPVMMLANTKMRVCLATTHIPLQSVSRHISEQSLTSIITIMHHDLQRLFAINEPVIGVCGLNPHAGESGYLGDEEIRIINPCLDKLRRQGLDIIGALPADTAFTPQQLKKMDAILCMYHDQGLPVIKHSGFGEIVNITLGLPIIRVSVDHGTAIDIAGRGNANEKSLITAIEQAALLSMQAKDSQ